MGRVVRLLRILGGIVCAGVVGAACGPAASTASATPSLDRQIQGDMEARDAIAWSAARPLRWSDFASSAPKAGDEGALTGYSIFYGVRCAGETFEFRAVAGFLPHESWVRPQVVADRAMSDRTLRHEQTHFDLTEVFARRLRKAFGDVYEPCRRADADLDALVTQYVRAEKTEQQRYDEETHHGLVAAEQAAWERKTAADLASLGQYGR
jgi:hypothetical protein